MYLHMQNCTCQLTAKIIKNSHSVSTSTSINERMLCLFAWMHAWLYGCIDVYGCADVDEYIDAFHKWKLDKSISVEGDASWVGTNQVVLSKMTAIVPNPAVPSSNGRRDWLKNWPINTNNNHYCIYFFLIIYNII